MATQPQKFTLLENAVPHVYRESGILFCDIEGASKILECSVERAKQKAERFDRLTIFGDRLYISADDLAFLIDEMQNPPSLAKQLAKKIHQTSSTELVYFFLFNQF